MIKLWQWIKSNAEIAWWYLKQTGIETIGCQILILGYLPNRTGLIVSVIVYALLHFILFKWQVVALCVPFGIILGWGGSVCAFRHNIRLDILINHTSDKCFSCYGYPFHNRCFGMAIWNNKEMDKVENKVYDIILKWYGEIFSADEEEGICELAKEVVKIVRSEKINKKRRRFYV
jgi:hypothetical protein